MDQEKSTKNAEREAWQAMKLLAYAIMLASATGCLASVVYVIRWVWFPY